MAIVITKQPVDVLAVVGDTVSFTVEATGVTTYQWEYSESNGKNWGNLWWTHPDTGEECYNTPTLVGKMNTARVKFLYRCKLTGEDGEIVYTSSARVYNVSGNFVYTGGVQTFTAPVTGLYKLTAVGANGAHNLTSVPKGGYSVGYIELKKGTVLFICVGQAGAFDGKAAYNGGGAGIKPTGFTWNNPSGSGGGATHIATADGTLDVLRASDDSQILIVAGGGGGESGHSGSGIAGVHHSNGGYGGGTSGGQGGTSNGNPNWYTNPGTQTGGGGKGCGANATKVGSVADGTDALAAGGGGGGYWGGYAGVAAQSGGGGGSGYIGGVPASITHKGTAYTAYTQGDYNTQENGRATIELIAKTTLPVIFDGTTLESIVFNGVEIAGLIVDGVQLFFKRLKRRFAAWYTSMKPALCLKAST